MIGLLAGLFIKDNKNYSDPKVRTAYGILCGVVGIVLNIILFSGKLIAGIISASVSVIADAFNNLSDAGSAVVSIAGYKIAAAPADREHPFGHGRAEYAAGLIVSTLIVFMSFEIGKEAISKIITPVEFTVDALSLVILCASIAIKLYIFAYNHSIGKKIGSAPMRAVAIDSLSDCISTLAAIAALVVWSVFGINIDGYIGLVISFIILKAGINAAKDSIVPLLGQKADDSFISGIRETAESFDGVVGIHDLYVHDYGVNRNVVSFHAEIPAETSFIAAHDIVDAMEEEISRKYNAVVTVHMDPVMEDNELSKECKTLIRSLLGMISADASMHDFRMTLKDGNPLMIFDVEIPFGLPVSDDELKERLISGIKNYNSSFDAVICIDKQIYSR